MRDGADRWTDRAIPKCPIGRGIIILVHKFVIKFDTSDFEVWTCPPHLKKILPPYIVKCRTRALRWNCVASSKNVDSSLTPSFLWLGKLTFRQATSLTSRQIVNGVHFKRWHTLLTYFHHQSIVLSSTHSQIIISGPQCNSFEQVSHRLQTPSTVLPPGKLL